MSSSALAEALRVGDRPKVHRAGTHRTLSPDDMLARVRPLMGRMEITRLSDVTGLDRVGVPVCQAVRPMARSLSVSQGKGLTLDAARVSAVMEAAEKFSAEDVFLPQVIGTMAECPAPLDLSALSPVQGIDPDRLARLPLTWVQGAQLCGGEAVFGPLDLVHMDFTLAPECPFLNRSSNGLASGSTLAEAALSALCELIERDALGDFLALPQGERDRRRVRAAALDDHGDLGPLCHAISAAGLELILWDVTNDLGIPTFLASVSERPGTPEARMHRPSDGAGCHLETAVALSRAITEALQSRLTVIAGVRDDLDPSDFRDHRAEGMARYLGDMFAAPSAGEPELIDLSGETAGADLILVAECLQKAGLHDIAIFDLTHPEIGLPVVRALVPGLGHVLPHGRHVPGKRHKGYHV